jgi:hypothetical protein
MLTCGATVERRAMCKPSKHALKRVAAAGDDAAERQRANDRCLPVHRQKLVLEFGEGKPKLLAVRLLARPAMTP